MNTELKITNRDQLPRGGFAGVRETRLVMPSGAASRGLGSFVYLADAEFVPNGQTGLHPHSDVDIVSIMLKGRIEHRGSLEDGAILDQDTVQVQRSGTGMLHNEVNPDGTTNRMLQVWFLPPRRGLEPGYRTYRPRTGSTITVLGGDDGESFDNASRLDIASPSPGEHVVRSGTFIAYIAEGEGTANGRPVREGDLLEGDSLDFIAGERAKLLIVTS